MHKTRLRPGQLAILLMLAATGMTAVQNTMIRLLADSGIHPFQIAFFRCVFGFISVAALVLWQMRKLPQTRSIGLSPPKSRSALALPRPKTCEKKALWRQALTLGAQGRQ